jgi:hypothetical protein
MYAKLLLSSVCLLFLGITESNAKWSRITCWAKCSKKTCQNEKIYEECKKNCQPSGIGGCEDAAKMQSWYKDEKDVIINKLQSELDNCQISQKRGAPESRGLTEQTGPKEINPREERPGKSRELMPENRMPRHAKKLKEDIHFDPKLTELFPKAGSPNCDFMAEDPGETYSGTLVVEKEKGAMKMYWHQEKDLVGQKGEIVPQKRGIPGIFFRSENNCLYPVFNPKADDLRQTKLKLMEVTGKTFLEDVNGIKVKATLSNSTVDIDENTGASAYATIISKG